AAVKPIELVGEYVAAMRRMALDDAHQLMAYGVPLRSITITCPAPSRVSSFRGRYVPDAAGAPGWIMPVCVLDRQFECDVEGVDPIASVSTGMVIDLVAFSPLAPRRWATRLGKAVALGAIPPQYLDPAPMRIFRDVTDWLRGGCGGLVPLTRDSG